MGCAPLQPSYALGESVFASASCAPSAVKMPVGRVFFGAIRVFRRSMPLPFPSPACLPRSAPLPYYPVLPFPGPALAL
jgi:hypothetical protein